MANSARLNTRCIAHFACPSGRGYLANSARLNTRCISRRGYLVNVEIVCGITVCVCVCLCVRA